jgi:hypothetical protein
MPYVTVFEITQKPFQWWFGAFGLIFVVIGIASVLIGKRWPSQKRAKITDYFMLVFASLWTMVAFASTFAEYRKCTEAYRTGSYAVVEGNVENFHPMPYEGHQDECFSVQGVRFCYSDYGVQAGFNQSASHGGPIRQGLPVRVAYYDGQILRLEVHADSLPSSSERSAYSTTAQDKWAQRAQKDPALDQMNLGFAFAVAFITLCWNLDWQHHMRYWIRRGPPYGRYWQWGFRAFFLANFVGSVLYLVQQILHKHRIAKDYEQGALDSLIWIGFFVVADGFFRWWLRRKKQSSARLPQAASGS